MTVEGNHLDRHCRTATTSSLLRFSSKPFLLIRRVAPFSFFAALLLLLAGSCSRPPTLVVATYSISGTVQDSSGTGIANVNVTLSSTGSTSTVTTGSDGTYLFSGLATGSYSIALSLAGYTFTSSVAQPVQVNGADVPGANFTATPIITYSISGTVVALEGKALAGVTMILTSQTTVPSPVVTNSSGSYTFSGLESGASYTVTPSLADYTFTSSVAQPVQINGADVTGVNFIMKSPFVE